VKKVFQFLHKTVTALQQVPKRRPDADLENTRIVEKINSVADEKQRHAATRVQVEYSVHPTPVPLDLQPDVRTACAHWQYEAADDVVVNSEVGKRQVSRYHQRPRSHEVFACTHTVELDSMDVLTRIEWWGRPDAWLLTALFLALPVFVCVARSSDCRPSGVRTSEADRAQDPEVGCCLYMVEGMLGMPILPKRMVFNGGNILFSTTKLF